MVENNGSNLGLHAGILMHKGKMMEFNSHMDYTHLAALKAPQKHTHLGTIDMWAYKRKSDTPFLSIAGIGSQNIIYAETDWLTYDAPTASDMSIEIVEDISGPDAGKGGTEFEILVNSKRLGGHGQVFKFDPRAKEELMITDAKIRIVDNDNVVYTVKRIDSDQPIDKFYLQTGVKLTPMHTEISPEFGQSYASFNIKTPNANKYIIPVGQVTQQVHYAVTTKVAQFNNGTGTFTVDGPQKQLMDQMFEYYFKIEGMSDNGLATMTEAMKNTAMKASVEDAFANNRVQIAISSLYDSLALKFLARGEQEYQLWGSGGVRNQGGMDEYYASVGAWQQLDTGYKFVGNLATFTLDTLKAAIYQYFWNKTDAPTRGQEPLYEVQTGMGGLQLMNRIISEQVNNQNLMMKVTDFGQVSGDIHNLSYKQLFFNEVEIPFVARLRFIYNAAFDPIENNEVVNPTLPGGFKLSSYSMIFHEVNSLAGRDNIKIVRSKESGNKVHMQIINGTAAHPLTEKAGPGGVVMHEGGTLKSGYSAYFRKQMDSLLVVDPTRVLKVVFPHPVTGITY